MDRYFLAELCSEPAFSCSSLPCRTVGRSPLSYAQHVFYDVQSDVTGSVARALSPGRSRHLIWESGIASSNFGHRLNRACSAHLASMRAS